MRSTELAPARIETRVLLADGVEQVLTTTPLRLTDTQTSLLRHISGLLEQVQSEEVFQEQARDDEQLIQATGPRELLGVDEFSNRLTLLERGHLDYDWPQTDAARLIHKWIMAHNSRFVTAERPVPFTSSEIAEWAVEQGWANEHDMSTEDVTRAVGNTLREIPQAKNLGNRKPARWAFIFGWTELPEEE